MNKGDRVKLSDTGIRVLGRSGEGHSKRYNADRRGTIVGVSRPYYQTKDIVRVKWDDNLTFVPIDKKYIEKVRTVHVNEGI